MSDARRPWWQSWAVPIAVVLVGVAAVAFVFVRAADDDGKEAGGDRQTAESIRSEWENRDPEDPMTFGPVDAPVGLVVFTDFQCPFCAKWTTDTLPVLLPYADRGQLRIEFRDMNIFGDESEFAARAAYAAALQGRLRDYQAALFEGGSPRPKDQLTDEAFFALAQRLDLDVPRFRADYGSRATLSAVRNVASDGFTAGTNTTPAFVLGNQPILGAQPTKVFTDALDKALKAAGR